MTIIEMMISIRVSFITLRASPGESASPLCVCTGLASGELCEVWVDLVAGHQGRPPGGPTQPGGRVEAVGGVTRERRLVVLLRDSPKTLDNHPLLVCPLLPGGAGIPIAIPPCPVAEDRTPSGLGVAHPCGGSCRLDANDLTRILL